MSENAKDIQVPPIQFSCHIVRRNMAGKLENPHIFKKVILALEENDKEEFKRICLEYGMRPKPPCIENVDDFIEQLWRAALASREVQSTSPCW